MSTISPVGTLAYIIDEEALLVRVSNGWQYIAVIFSNYLKSIYFNIFSKIFLYEIQLGSLLPISASPQVTTKPPPSHPPFEASNLINQVPIKVDSKGVSIFINYVHTV